MPLPSQTQQKSDNKPLPAKKTIHEGEGHMNTQKIYITFIHKLFDYLLITPLNINRTSDKLQYPVSKYSTKDKSLNCFFKEC